MKKIILASCSPRRSEILKRFNIEFEIKPSSVDEDFTEGEDPKDVVEMLALRKCRDVANRSQNGEIVIAADTIVVYSDKILGKPVDKSDARKMIHSLSGKSHQVITGIAIIDVETGIESVDCQVTDVLFRHLTDDKIERYLNTEEYVDKAGAYGIQGYGEVLVKSINGSFSNVVGLPISKLDEMLEDKFDLKLL